MCCMLLYYMLLFVIIEILKLIKFNDVYLQNCDNQVFCNFSLIKLCLI